MDSNDLNFLRKALYEWGTNYFEMVFGPSKKEKVKS